MKIKNSKISLRGELINGEREAGRPFKDGNYSKALRPAKGTIKIWTKRNT